MSEITNHQSPVTNDYRGALVDVAVVVLGAVAAVYILKTPSLRRAAWRLLKYGFLTAAPHYLWQETAQAWAESAHN